MSLEFLKFLVTMLKYRQIQNGGHKTLKKSNSSENRTQVVQKNEKFLPQYHNFQAFVAHILSQEKFNIPRTISAIKDDTNST